MPESEHFLPLQIKNYITYGHRSFNISPEKTIHPKWSCTIASLRVSNHTSQFFPIYEMSSHVIKGNKQIILFPIWAWDGSITLALHMLGKITMLFLQHIFSLFMYKRTILASENIIATKHMHYVLIDKLGHYILA